MTAKSVQKHTVLVCEDEPLIALDLQQELEKFDWAVLGPFRCATDALSNLHPWVGAAVMGFNSNDPGCVELLEQLCVRGVPVVIYSGFAPDGSFGSRPYVTFVGKPSPSNEVALALAQVAGKRKLISSAEQE